MVISARGRSGRDLVGIFDRPARGVTAAIEDSADSRQLALDSGEPLVQCLELAAEIGERLDRCRAQSLRLTAEVAELIVEDQCGEAAEGSLGGLTTALRADSARPPACFAGCFAGGTRRGASSKSKSARAGGLHRSREAPGACRQAPQRGRAKSSLRACGARCPPPLGHGEADKPHDPEDYRDLTARLVDRPRRRMRPPSRHVRTGSPRRRPSRRL